MALISTSKEICTPGDVSIVTLETLSNHVGTGLIALPEFQRPQVWNNQERKELVISLCLGVPIGSYLLWEYDADFDDQKDLLIEEFPHVSTNKQKVEYLLVDGQQRMTTISQLETSEFALSHKVEFRKISESLTRPIIHKIPGVKDDNGKMKKPYFPDLKTINKKREIRISDLAGKADPKILDADAQKVVNTFRNSVNGTNIPVYIFPKTERRQWVVYVYQTCNLAGKPLNDTDHAEAALGYVYPDLKDKIDDFVPKLTLWEDKSKPRKLILRSMLDELYNSPHFSHCKKWGLDVLDPRIITEQPNQNKKIDEKSNPLTKPLVENALKLTKNSFIKLQDLILSSWHLKNPGKLLENELLVMLAWYREYEKQKKTPSSIQRGEMSKHMMLSMAQKPTTGGSTQQMASKACNYVRESLDDCWEKIHENWGYNLEIQKVDFGDTSKEVAQIKKEEFIFHLYKLSIFTDDYAVDLFDSTSITSSTVDIQIDHFYPKSRLGHLSDIFSLMKRRDHLANYVVMKSWSNNSKKDIIPDFLISENKLWPDKDKNKQANFDAHCIPKKKNSGTWIVKGQENFDILKLRKKQITNLRKKIKNPRTSKTDLKIFEKDMEKFEAEIDKISESLGQQYVQFLNWRIKLMVKRVNHMLDRFEKNGI